MSPLALMIVVLTVIVGALLFSGLALAVHQHPQLVQPILVGLTGLALMVAVIGLVTNLRT